MKTKIRTHALVVALAMIATPLMACDDDPVTPADPDSTILETAVAAGSFETLVAAIRAAGLEEALNAPGPFTVFAPTDAAFATLPAGTVESLLEPANRGQLEAILLAHVVSGRLTAEDVVGRSEIVTLGGRSLPVVVENGIVTVGGAAVLQTDVSASNGVIHAIGSVIVPQ
ncbi:MAG TPA: fasciclin domain-containing protein [Gemmatimonadota bacterium]|nr:fasciclin domain-containing protein [Gemmatimonadota bacterium]